jgi:hypothetical protein
VVNFKVDHNLFIKRRGTEVFLGVYKQLIRRGIEPFFYKRRGTAAEKRVIRLTQARKSNFDKQKNFARKSARLSSNPRRFFLDKILV